MTLQTHITVTATCDGCHSTFPCPDGDEPYHFQSETSAKQMLSTPLWDALPAWEFTDDGRIICGDCVLTRQIAQCLADGGHHWRRVVIEGRPTVYVDCACGAVETIADMVPGRPHLQVVGP